jgi:hypothetical protein
MKSLIGSPSGGTLTVALDCRVQPGFPGRSRTGLQSNQVRGPPTELRPRPRLCAEDGLSKLSTQAPAQSGAPCRSNLKKVAGPMPGRLRGDPLEGESAKRGDNAAWHIGRQFRCPAAAHPAVLLTDSRHEATRPLVILPRAPPVHSTGTARIHNLGRLP